MYHHKFSRLNFVCCSLAFASAVCAFSAPAAAGFQWVAPSEPAAVDSSPVIISGDSATVAPYASTLPSGNAVANGAPVVIDGSSAAQGNLATAAPAYPAPTAPQPSFLDVPAASSPAPLMAAQPLNDPAPKQDEKVLNGFGNKIPLAVALRQVLPPNYGFSVDQDISLSSSVSWRGGKPWREVLRETLQPAGFDFVEKDQMIRIVRSKLASISAGSPGLEAVSAPLPAVQPTPKVQIKKAEHVLALPPGMTPEAAGVTPQVAVAPAAPAPLVATVPVAPVPVAMPIMDQSYGSPVAAAPVKVVDTWNAGRGDMLRKVLEGWAKRANVEFNWKLEYDYPLQASISVSGSFEDAVRNLLAGFQEAQPQPVAKLYNNPTAGQTVLVVESRGNNYSD